MFSWFIVLFITLYGLKLQEYMDAVSAAKLMEEHANEMFAEIRMNSNGSVKTDNYVVGDKEAHAKRFRKISDDLQLIQKHYLKCLNNLSDNSFEETTIDECVGKNYSTISHDMHYFKEKILATVDNHIRANFVELCYEAAEDEIMLQSCDLFEKDTLDVLWAGLNIHKVAYINRSKYLDNEGVVPEHIFKKLVARFEKVYAELGEILKEIKDHHMVIIEEVKKAVEERSKLIVLKAKKSGGHTTLPKITTHQMEVTQTLHGNSIPNVHKMPSVLMDGSTKLYADWYGKKNEKKPKFNPGNFNDLIHGPHVVIPIRKLEKHMDDLRRKLRKKKHN